MQQTQTRHIQPVHTFVRRLARCSATPGRFFVGLAAFCSLCAGVLFPGGVDAAEPTAEIGVFSLDREPGSVEATRSLVEHLRSTEAVVYDEPRIRARLDDTSVDPSKHAGAPSGLTESITAGIRQFFYQSREDAVATLEAAVDRGLEHLPALARRADLAEQVFEAGIVLVRAARITEAPASSGSGAPSLAVETARRIAVAFPTRVPSPETAPPAIVELFEQARAETAAHETRLRLDVPDNDCTGFINGMATENVSIPVAPEVTYYVRLDCSRETSQLRRVELREGQTLTLPLFIGPILPATFDVRGEASHPTTGRRLERVLAWTGLTTLVAIRQTGRGASRRTTVLRLSEGSVLESSQYEGRFRPDAFARQALGLEPAAETEVISIQGSDRRDGSPGPGFDIGLLATGGVSMGVSSWLFVAAARNHRLLRCSANAADPLPNGRCDGASTQGVSLSEGDATSREAQINRQRILGVALGAVGIAGATWGIVRLLKRPAPGEAIDTEQLRATVVFTHRSASVVLNF